MSFNLAIMVRESAASHPDKPAVILDDVKLTHRQIDELSDRVASALRASGIEAGQSIGLMLPNIPQFVIAYAAILKAGCVVVPMNVLLKAPEVAYYLRDSQARALFVWDGVAAEAVKGAAQAGDVTVYVVEMGGPPRPEGTRSSDELLAGDAPFDIVPTDADDTAVLLYTSGTTGRPKGAELTHFQLYMNCDIAGRLFGVKEDDVCMGVLPLFHVFGLSSVLNLSMRFGGTLSLVPRFDAGKVVEVMARDRVTVFAGVPTMFFALNALPDLEKHDLSAFRVAVSGGASIPGEVIRAFEEKFGVVILEGYGLSESASSTTFNRSAEERRVLSIGKPIWGVEVRVVDDDDRPLPPGKDSIGEIVIRGHNMTKGYFNMPEATAEAFKNGWFHTGDLGYRDEDGFFYIVDRKKELIIRGGYNVYPREIEEVLYGHPAVAEAAVIGVPDDRLGEEVAAAVTLKAGQRVEEAELIAWCKERMAAYKYPRSIEFRDSLPKGPTGKILKRELVAERKAARR